MAAIILDPNGSGEPDSAGDRIVTRDSVDVRLGVYANGYPARIAEALREAYPALLHVVGNDEFHRLVHRYLPHVPAGNYNLSEVGARLPEFLADDELGNSLPFATDLARLEWAVHRAFHAPELEPFDAASVAAWTEQDWQNAVLEFQPAVALVRSLWPIRSIWQARSTPRDQIDIELEGRPEQAVVYRAGFRVACDAIAEAEAAVLATLLDGEPLGRAMQIVADSSADPQEVTGWFARWSAGGLLAACRTCSDG